MARLTRAQRMELADLNDRVSDLEARTTRATRAIRRNTRTIGRRLTRAVLASEMRKSEQRRRTR